MPEAVKGTRRAYSVGSLMMYIQPLTKVDDTSTHASALNAVRSHWATITDILSTNTSNAGSDVGVATGTFTFNHGEDDRNTDLYILATELE